VENSETSQDILNELNTKSVLTKILNYRKVICLHWQSAERQASQINEVQWSKKQSVTAVGKTGQQVAQVNDKLMLKTTMI
jgi:hypothetical protein